MRGARFRPGKPDSCQEDRRHGADDRGDQHHDEREIQAEQVRSEELVRLHEGDDPAKRKALRWEGQVVARVEAGEHDDHHGHQQDEQGGPGADSEPGTDVDFFPMRFEFWARPPVEPPPGRGARGRRPSCFHASGLLDRVALVHETRPRGWRGTARRPSWRQTGISPFQASAGRSAAV